MRCRRRPRPPGPASGPAAPAPGGTPPGRRDRRTSAPSSPRRAEDLPPLLRSAGRQDPVALFRHEDVVLDPDPDAEKLLRHLLLVGPHVEARLDRQDHPRLELPRLAVRVAVPAPV